ncbi:hypothetical protein MK852_00625 [Shewanella benthica]|uniref:hypothetical protein n=1 Tax=Shewanella benthica TaxID=43661 RepID=UPI0018795977|nr:hypothetical protein [Shewanella benthica]MBE7214536.1 hypothetical protein [Shewanella benthica]MCL1060653.1 hypothetical protein [Shewanella benthica]
MAFIPRPRFKPKSDSTRVFPAAAFTALIVIGALSNITSLTFDSNTHDSKLAVPLTQTQGVRLSFNRYQAGFACRENGWEFCAKWAYPRGLLA